ncbi:SGNH/GDSL hydrolase family protein [Ruania zhangjianzhongii]|uniref:SGNH/GDSL hydrolase family protein n=1 Tax=Ruania zhangjianzhongii TaxID=2603206 RepID=UPI001F316CF4|nr:SGNH/GDSL hydrolase family protein [Ruania zhangjianzhongii]
MTILLTGDSITDCGRDRDDIASLGSGYAALVAAGLPEERVINTGIGGNRVKDLQARWQADVLAHDPVVLSIMIGINDTWRRYDSDDPTSAEVYESGYRDILTRSREAGIERIVLVEPFLLPVREDQWAWREDLDPKIQVVRRLAAEFGTDYLATDGPLAEVAARTGAEALAHDGVHLTEAGHRLLADRWLELHRA